MLSHRNYICQQTRFGLINSADSGRSLLTNCLLIMGSNSKSSKLSFYKFHSARMQSSSSDGFHNFLKSVQEASRNHVNGIQSWNKETLKNRTYGHPEVKYLNWNIEKNQCNTISPLFLCVCVYDKVRYAMQELTGFWSLRSVRLSIKWRWRC